MNYNDVSNELNKTDVGIFFKKFINYSFIPYKNSRIFHLQQPIISNNFNNDIHDVIDFKRGFLVNDLKELNSYKINKLKNIILDNYSNEYCLSYASNNLINTKILEKF